MKKIILTAFLSLFVFTSFSQTLSTTSGIDKYIEIKVTDTLMAAPDFIKFMISLENADMFDYEDYYGDEDADVKNVRKTNNKEKLTKNQVELILDKLQLKYVFNEATEKGSGMTKGLGDLNIYGNSFEVTLNSMEQLKQLQNELTKVDDIESMVMSTGVSNQKELELKLIEKLMVQARKEADAIAKGMGVTLDKPLNVTNTSLDEIYSNMFKGDNSLGGLGAIFSLMGNMFKSSSQQAEVVVSKTLIIRYSYK